MRTYLSIIGSGRIVEEHIKAALKNKISVKYIFSSRKNSKNAKKLAQKYKINNIENFNNFLKLANNLNSNFLIAGRIKDNNIFLNECLKTKNKIFIEKPIFIKSKLFNKYLKYNKRIFVGYNRIFYSKIEFIKKVISKEKNLSINCLCPESSKDRILTNGSHIISLLLYLNGNLRLVYKEKTRNIIFIRFIGKNNSRININFHIKSLSNFRVEFISKNFLIIMSPIERVRLFNKLKKIKYKNNNHYKLICSLDLNENLKSNIKPGLDLQMKHFKNFCKNHKVVNDLKFAKKVISICENIKK